jgi:hypothetical protein
VRLRQCPDGACGGLSLQLGNLQAALQISRFLASLAELTLSSDMHLSLGIGSSERFGV